MPAESGGCCRLQHDERADDMHVGADGQFRAGDFGNVGMVGEHAFHLGRRDAIAERLDDLVVAAFVRDVAVDIHATEIAADEPLAAHDVRLLGGTVPVAEHQARVGAMDGDEAFRVRTAADRWSLKRE